MTRSLLITSWLGALALGLVGCGGGQQQTIGWAGDPVKVASPANTQAQGSRSAGERSKELGTAPARPSTSRQASTATAAATTAKPAVRESAAPTRAPAPTKGAVVLPAATYAEIVEAHNRRVARLDRLWTIAVASMEFTDESGKRRREQGEGHFQVIQPSKMALTVGKLGDVFVLLGCDPERYWVIDAKEGKRAFQGRHSQATRAKVQSFGLPAPPRELLALAGITPLPTISSDPKRRPVVTQVENGRAMAFEVAMNGSVWRYTVDAKSFQPKKIEVLESPGAEPAIVATLENYQPVPVSGSGEIPPKMATRIRCFHPASASTLSLTVSDMVANPAAKKLPDQVFKFDELVSRFGVREIVDVDQRAAADAGSVGNAR